MTVKRSARGGKPTIFDVAALAGVSIKTVSRVANNEPNVQARTRERVLDAIRQLQYKPNAAARGLSGKRSWVIGLVYENPHEFSYMKDVLNGALNVCEREGYTLLLRPIALPNPTLVDDIRQFAIQARLDGIVLPAPLGDYDEVLALLREMKIPCARIAPREPVPGVISVFCNDEAASRALTVMLLEQGHRRIGFIKGHPAHAQSEKRYAGFRAALKGGGVRFDRALVRQGYFDFESGKAATARLLSLAQPPTAIIASNDDMAAGAVFEACERGLKVPEQLSVVGFDDSQIAAQIWPPLTTVRQPTIAMAETATARLIARLRGDESGFSDEPFECEVVVRNSTRAL